VTGARFMHPGPVVLPVIIATGAELTATLNWVSGEVFSDNLCFSPTRLSVSIQGNALHTAFKAHVCGQRSGGCFFSKDPFYARPVYAGFHPEIERSPVASATGRLQSAETAVTVADSNGDSGRWIVPIRVRRRSSGRFSQPRRAMRKMHAVRTRDGKRNPPTTGVDVRASTSSADGLDTGTGGNHLVALVSVDDGSSESAPRSRPDAVQSLLAELA
jgi:hypothetical protein